MIKGSFAEKLRVTDGFSPPKIIVSCVKVAVPFVKVEVHRDPEVMCHVHLVKVDV